MELVIAIIAILLLVFLLPIIGTLALIFIGVFLVVGVVTYIINYFRGKNPEAVYRQSATETTERRDDNPDVIDVEYTQKEVKDEDSDHKS